MKIDSEAPKVDTTKTDLLLDIFVGKENTPPLAIDHFYDAKKEAEAHLERMDELTGHGLSDDDMDEFTAIINFFNEDKYKALFMFVYPTMDLAKLTPGAPVSGKFVESLKDKYSKLMRSNLGMKLYLKKSAGVACKEILYNPGHWWWGEKGGFMYMASPRVTEAP